METLWQDLRYALRQLTRDRGFAAAAILTFTLGIGAAAAMFTVVDALVLGEMPYREPDRLVFLGGSSADKAGVKPWAVSQSDWQDWRKESTVFSDMSLFGSMAFNLEQGERSQRLSGELVNDSYFRLLGLEPARGRFLAPEEDRVPMERYVVVLGHDLWQGSFGGDPGIVGREVRLNGRSFQVVGVGPRGFRGLTDEVDLWIPSMVPPNKDFLTSRRQRWASGVARLKPGVTIEQAREQLAGVTAALAEQYPDTNEGIGARVLPLSDYWFGRFRLGLVILTAGAGILLLIACINVASLSLTRAAGRQANLGVRVALGASRRRLARQLLTESLVISLIGAFLGCLLAHWGSRALVAASGIVLPSFVRVGIDPGVIAVTVGLALLCGLAFGLAPLAASLRADLTGALARDGKLPRGGGRNRFRGAVVVAQVALVLLLAVAAGLLAKGYRKLLAEDLGFSSGNLLTLRMDPRGPKYADEAVVTRLLREDYLPRLAALPGVERLAISDPTLPTDGKVGGYITVEEHDSDAPDGTWPTSWHAVTPDYFRLLGIPLLKGRTYDSRDTSSNAVIVSKTMAETHWPGRDPLGKRIKLGPRDSEMLPWLTVVGVAGDVRHAGYRNQEGVPAYDIYLSLFQFIRRPPLRINFLVEPKPGVSTGALTRALYEELEAIDPELPAYDAATLAARLHDQTARERFQLTLIGLFTAVALALAAVGIYGVVAYGVAQRQKEIALRLSLGADRGRILRMVVGRGALLAAAGLALGLAAVLVLGRSLSGLLYQTSATDPMVLGGTALVLFLVTLAANYLPARRAARLDPTVGLRLQ